MVDGVIAVETGDEAPGSAREDKDKGDQAQIGAPEEDSTGYPAFVCLVEADDEQEQGGKVSLEGDEVATSLAQVVVLFGDLMEEDGGDDADGREHCPQADEEDAPKHAQRDLVSGDLIANGETRIIRLRFGHEEKMRANRNC